MSEKQNRILIFGAGVIGSVYAIKFIEAGIDVTMFARSNRFKTLKANGIQYNEKGVVKSIKVNAMLGVLYSENKTIDEKTARTRKTAHKITFTLKTYLRAIQKAGVTIDPSSFKVMLNCPNLILNFIFMLWLRTKMVKDMMLPDYASSANNEIVQLRNDLLKFLNQNDITP